MEDVLSFVDWRTNRLYYNSRMFDSNKHNMINGELVERADYKKNKIEAELNGLASQKAYLQSQLNVFSDKLLTIEEKFEAKKAELKELE